MKKFKLIPLDKILGLETTIESIPEGYPKEFTHKNKEIYYGDDYKENKDVLIINNDTLKCIKKIPDNSAMLVVSSPPYNLGKPYEKRVEFEEYLSWQREVTEELVRVLKTEGSLCWQVGNYIENGEVFPLDIYFYDIFKGHGLFLRNRIVWRFGHGLHTQKRFSGRYETILWFTKSEEYVFNLDPVRIPQKYPGKKAFRGPNRGKLSGNPLGKNPSDVWDPIEQEYPSESWRIEYESSFSLKHHKKPIEKVEKQLKELFEEEWRTGIWDIPNVKSNHPEKTIHTSQFPIELIERLVLALTNENDVVLDPFSGVGSALVAAILQQRKAIGIDYEKQYNDIALERCIQALDGTIKKRELGKQVYKPKGKIAEIPAEFKKARIKRGRN